MVLITVHTKDDVELTFSVHYWCALCFSACYTANIFQIPLIFWGVYYTSVRIVHRKIRYLKRMFRLLSFDAHFAVGIVLFLFHTLPVTAVVPYVVAVSRHQRVYATLPFYVVWC